MSVADITKKKTLNETRVTTTIGQGTCVTGEVECKGTIRIEGEVRGRVHSDDTIIVVETGKVKADLIAQQIIIGGEVHGNVYAYERMEVTDNGKLTGDVVAPRVSIAEGVIFEGSCAMKPPGDILAKLQKQQGQSASQPQQVAQAPQPQQVAQVPQPATPQQQQIPAQGQNQQQRPQNNANK